MPLRQEANNPEFGRPPAISHPIKIRAPMPTHGCLALACRDFTRGRMPKALGRRPTRPAAGSLGGVRIYPSRPVGGGGFFLDALTRHHMALGLFDMVAALVRPRYAR